MAVDNAGLVRETGAMTKPLVVKWAYRYHRLQFDYFNSLQEAVEAAVWASDAGEEALESFEVWDDTGYRLIPHDEAYRLTEEESSRRYEEYKAKSDQRVFVAELWVKAPDGTETQWSAFESMDRANEVMAELAPMGHRARLKILNRPSDGDGEPR